MKLLIVTTKSTVFFQELAKILEDVEIVICGHSEAFSDFFAEEPDVVLVDEYYEHDRLPEEAFAGKEVFKDLQLSAMDEQVVLRCGFLPLPYDDYLELPFLSEDFREFLTQKTGG